MKVPYDVVEQSSKIEIVRAAQESLRFVVMHGLQWLLSSDVYI